MKAGDYCRFPAGQKIGHALVNESGETCRFLIIGESNPNEVSVYTRTGKVEIRSLGARLYLTETVDYWEGEERA
jgi:uncharacterized cupin superfamily protein